MWGNGGVVPEYIYLTLEWMGLGGIRSFFSLLLAYIILVGDACKGWSFGDLGNEGFFPTLWSGVCWYHIIYSICQIF